MDTGLLVAIIVIVVILVVVAVLVAQRRRSQGLQDRFGPEYERTVAREGDRRTAESRLTEREKRRRELDIVELDSAARTRYLEAWRVTQGKFVDDPAAATGEADTLVATVMRERGYPVDDFDQRAADISVDHPKVAEDYRAAHAISQANEQGLATTDDLRQAFVHYRSLFVELLEPDGDAHRADGDARRADDDALRADHDAHRADDDALRADDDALRADGDARRADDDALRADDEARRADDDAHDRRPADGAA
jgi:hypothetical protein